MEVLLSEENKMVVKFNKKYDHIDIMLPNGSYVQVQPDHFRGGITLRGVPNIGLGTVCVYPAAGNFIYVTVDENQKERRSK